MKKQIVIFCGLLSASASAVTLDYRHEWQDDSRVHKDRITVSHRFANGVGFALETKWKSGGDDPNKAFHDTVSNGSESSINWQYKVTPQWFLQPGFTLESGSDSSIYKPLLLTGYDFNNGFYLNGRYRYEYKRESKPGKEDMKTNRGEFWLGYNFTDWRIEYNYIYKHSDQIRFDNKKWDYEHNLKARWKYSKALAPYIEVGNISVHKNSDERQTRMRTGIQYSF
jgi:hypothetical protein